MAITAPSCNTGPVSVRGTKSTYCSPMAETLRTFRDFGFRVVAVDRSGAIDRSRYVAAGLCDGFLLPEELDAQLISPVRPPADT